mgnify:FL=1
MKVIDLNKKYNKNTRLEEIVTISCDDGECYVNSLSGVAGLQIKFEGKPVITPQLPNDWYLQGNNNTIIIFTLNNLTLSNEILFTYEGFMQVIDVIACNNKAERYTEKFTKSGLSWGSSNWSMDIEADTWDNFKDKRRKGKVSITSYNLPDYGLPKVDKTKTKTRRRTTTSRVSSGGSGGY